MVILRKATESDLPLIMAWRSNPLVYQGFYSQKDVLKWEEHFAWWESRPSSWQMFIIILSENIIFRDIGVVNIGQLEHWSPEIGYFIGNPSDWGKGYGKEAVGLACERLKEKGYEYCHTTIKNGNQRSVSLISSLGFVIGDKAREGESWYHKKL